MKGLKTLIRLHKRKLDELRREYVGIERQRDRLLEAQAALAAELQSEIDAATAMPEMGNFFGDYAERIKKRQETLAAEVHKLELLLSALQDRIRESFTELKRYEIALAAAQKRAKAKEERQERLRLDDVAIDQFIRREDHPHA